MTTFETFTTETRRPTRNRIAAVVVHLAASAVGRPPVVRRSTSTTGTPKAAAAVASAMPRSPAPTTQRSGVSAAGFAVFALASLTS